MAVVYGHNGSGKSNLGLAIFDLIIHLTDRYPLSRLYKNYLNADSDSSTARFTYEFKLLGAEVIYSYEKSDHQTLIKESLHIDGEEYFAIDRNISSVFTTTAKGTESLKKDTGNTGISISNYLERHSLLEDNRENAIFLAFTQFVKKMLYFKYTDDINYSKYCTGREEIPLYIVEQNLLEDFEIFLNAAGIACNLIAKEYEDGKPTIFFKFKHRELPFYEIASSGTKSLALFYYWFQRVKANDGVSFLFIDEFDAFYHHDLSLSIVNLLKQLPDTQVVLTTHNTAIISNEVLRPDCYFLMYPEKIQSLADKTRKELR